MAVTTPNMNLVVSTINVDSGLVWEENLNSSLLIIDGHNHSPGYGAQINPTGLNINTNLPMGGNNLTLVRSINFQSQASPLNLAADVGCLYVSGADLYYNDENGNHVQITSGGNVNATSSGISSGTATASFVSSVLVVNAASNTPANIQGASLLLGNNVAASKFLTLSPPSAMAANFSLTLPSLPASQKFMTLDASGNIAAPWSPDNSTTEISSNLLQVKASGITATQLASNSVTTAKIVDLNVTKSKLSSLGQQISSSCGSFSTASGSYVAVTNLSVTINTIGRPVFVGLVSDNSSTSAGQGGFISVVNTAGQAAQGGFEILNAGSNIGSYELSSQANGASTIVARSPSSSLWTIDLSGVPGSNTYTVRVALFSGTALLVNNSKLIAYEI